ncbi:type II toxin-antitoxin system YafO family toxin [Vibrio alginolyticus]|uniref:type II toxin-antitoxin system YafO family toxin n=1 Tax=Vibrio alginolyticus TaxID=663 RepID=UPI003C12D237|nr:type II toxin-antitoxin system YafO family toxin [Vibrio parahaemolyticus]
MESEVSSDIFIKRQQFDYKESHSLVFTLDAKLDDGKALTKVYTDFIDYKCSSSDEDMPAPSEDIQKDYEPQNSFFGKDTANRFPKPKVANENIYHVHVFDGSRSWNIWEAKEQFYRVCDTLLFYSSFLKSNTRYFHILDFLYNPDGDNKSHQKMKDDIYMQALADRAELYRKSI